MSYNFDIRKTIQAVGVLLRLEPGHRMNYMRLLKLLYIAERESFRETGRPIIGDRMIAMKRGPVPGNTLDLIKDQHLKSPEWSKFVRRERYDVQLVEDPGNGALSRHEIAGLQRVSADHADHDEWEMVEVTHEFEEWRRNYLGDSSKAIPLEDILDAVGRSSDKDVILRDLKEEEAMRRIFSGVPS